MAPISREYDFVPGPETSTLPDVSDPSGDGDTMTLGFSNNRWYWGEPVASYAAVRALTATQRVNYQTRKVKVNGAEDWYFDDSSTATDDGATVLKPDDLGALDPGRWLINPGSGGGGGGGGGASGLESLIQKQELERHAIFTDPLDNSVNLSGARAEYITRVEGNLLESLAISDTTAKISWNTVFLNDSDKNVDATTNWAVGSAGSTLTATATAGEFKVGTQALKFDKNNSAVDAYIRYNRGSANLYLNANSRALFWIYLPSITNLTNVFIMLEDASANTRRWDVTTNEAGGALAIGWNFISVDLSNTTGTTAGGSGVTISNPIQYVRVGVITNPSTQTYTGIIVDGPWFSARYANQFGFTGSELTLFDDSNKEDIVISSANTRLAGTLTLVSAVANAYAASFTSANRARIKRATMTSEANEGYYFDNDSALSGEIDLEQEIRGAVIARENVSGDFQAYIDAYPVQMYEIVATDVADVDVTDQVDQSANLLSGDTVDIFSVSYADGEAFYTKRLTTTLTGNSSHLSGVTTVPISPGTTAVGDVLLKRNLVDAEFSVANIGANEVMGNLTPVSAPNDVQLVNVGADYPNKEYIWGHWYLGAENSSEGRRNRFGVGSDLAEIGAPNYQGDFFKNRFSATGLNGSSIYFQISAANSEQISGDSADSSRISGQIWVYMEPDTTEHAIIARFTGSGGWAVYKNSSDQIVLRLADGSVNNYTTATVTAPGWFHLAWDFADGSGIAKFWVNGQRYDLSTGNIGDAITFFYIGSTSGIGNPTTTMRFADAIIWRNGPQLTQNQVDRLYNGGNYYPVGGGPIQRYLYSNTGQTGGRIAIKAVMARSTTAVRPIISKIGIIKTG